MQNVIVESYDLHFSLDWQCFNTVCHSLQRHDFNPFDSFCIVIYTFCIVIYTFV